MTDFAPAEELANLKEKLEATREKFGSWNESLIKEVQEWFMQYSGKIDKHEQHLNELREGLTKLKSQNEADKEAAAETLQSLETARNTLKTVQETLDMKISKNTDLEADLKAEIEAFENEKMELENAERASKQRTNEMSQMALLTKEFLGLSFQKAPGQKMQVVFRQIDPNNPDDPFILSVAIKARKYEVSDCQPEIPDLEQLVEKLNETNNFRSFLITVRSRFQKMV